MSNEVQHALYRPSKNVLGASMPRLHSQQQGKISKRCRGVEVHAAKDVDFADRAVGALPYLVPLFDGIKYGEMSHLPLSMLPDSNLLSVRSLMCVSCQLTQWSCNAGRFLFLQFPFLPRLLAPLNPLISFYFSFPFARCINPNSHFPNHTCSVRLPSMHRA